MPNYLDLMVDIESLSTHKYNALVLAVAAVPFAIESEHAAIGDHFMRKISVIDQITRGREISASTQAWWNAPEQATAWRGWEDQSDAVSINDFCMEFATFYRNAGFKRVWSRGICFDLCNVESLFEAYGHRNCPCPWLYNAPMDQRSVLRTMEWSVERIGPEAGIPARPESHFEPHHPVGDCEKQIWDMYQHGIVTSTIA